MQRRIVINGVEYDSPEDMPPEARRVYEELMKDRDGNGVPDVVEELGQNNVISQQRIIVNGRECKSLDELPPAVRDTLAQLGGHPSRTRVTMHPHPAITTPRWIWLAVGIAAGAILTLLVLKFASR